MAAQLSSFPVADGLGMQSWKGPGGCSSPSPPTHTEGKPSPGEGKAAVPGPRECAVDTEPEAWSSALVGAAPAFETEKHVSNPSRGWFTRASQTAAESQKPAACMWWGATEHGPWVLHPVPHPWALRPVPHLWVLRPVPHPWGLDVS